MNNQSFFDSAFILARINECIAICGFQVERSFENEDLFQKSYEQAQRWLVHYKLSFCASTYKVVHFETLLDTYNLSFLTHRSLLDFGAEILEAVQVLNAKNQSVSKPVTSARMQVFRVLGQVFETDFPKISNNWAFNQYQTKQLLSNTRPVGGLA